MTPLGWRECTLGDLAEETGGRIQTGPFGSQLHASDYLPDGIPVVMPVNIGDNRLVEAGVARVGPNDAKRLSRHRLRAGDIVYSRRGDVEKRALVRERQVDWLCGTGCLLVRVQGDEVDATYVSYWLGSPEIKAWVTQHAIGATMPNLNTGILSAVPVLVPPLAEQKSIATTLTALDDKIESNRRTIDTCSGLLDATSSSLALELDSVPLSALAAPFRDAFDPSALGAERIDHFSIPAFDAKGLPDRTCGASVISAKLRVDQPSVLVSRLNPATNRTWFAVPEPGVGAGCSTEFLVLTPTAGVTLGSLWLAVRDEGFRSLLAQRATGTSGSHQRVKAQDALATEAWDVRQLSAAAAQAADELLWLMHQRRVEATRLAALRDALLPELLSGRIRVPEAGGAVESALA